MSLPGQPTEYVYDNPDPLVLQKFPSPFLSGQEAEVLIEAPEFSCLCPLTGQPDWATIVVKYRPREWCVESKSYKLYLGRFRMHRDFHESTIAIIAEHLNSLLEPKWLEVVGRFTPRGGIAFWPTVTYDNEA